jgi:hypothetical protein
MSLDVGKEVVGRRESTAPPTPSTGRRAVALLLVFLLGFTSGCYTFTPVVAVPEPGTELALGLNDQGRVSLGQSVGPSAQTIEGRLSAKNDSAYVIAVRSVRYFNGGTNVWSGESLSVGTSLVQEARVRRFSPSKTALVVAAAAGGVLAFILSRSIFGSASPDKTPNGGPPDGS